MESIERMKIMKEKEIRKMITIHMIDELQKRDDYVLTNVSYGNDFSKSVTAENVDDSRKRLTVGLKRREGESDIFDYVMKLDGEETYYSTIYRINSDIYTTFKDEFLKAKKKQIERYKRHPCKHKSVVRKIKVSSKFHEKYMDIVKEVEMNTRGRKIKDCELTLVKQGRTLAIDYKHRGREYAIIKNIGCSVPWTLC